MKRTLLVCALAAIWTANGGAQPTSMHEDVLDGFNGSISLSLVTRTMIPRTSSTMTIPANEHWQHFHQIARPHFIEAYNATKSTLKNVSGVNARGCEVKPTDTIHIYFTRKDKSGTWSSPNVALDGDIVVSQTQVSGVGAKVPAHRELAAGKLGKTDHYEAPTQRRLRDEDVRPGLEAIGPQHTKHIDWIWKVALKNSNYAWSPGTTASGRYETAIQRVAGGDQDWRMADLVVKGPPNPQNVPACSFTLAECGYFRLHRNKEEKNGGTAEIQKLQRPLKRFCKAFPVEKKVDTRKLPTVFQK